MVLPRAAVLELGGFDERFGPEEAAEDNEFCYRWLKAGRRLRYEPALVVEHHDWRSPDELERLYVRYARGEGFFYAKHLRRGRPPDAALRRVATSSGRLRGSRRGVVKGREPWTDSPPRDPRGHARRASRTGGASTGRRDDRAARSASSSRRATAGRCSRRRAAECARARRTSSSRSSSSTRRPTTSTARRAARRSTIRGVRIVRHETQRRLPGARNGGAEAASGTWLAFLDDDDLWAPRKLRAQLDAAQATGAAWVYAQCVVVDGHGRPLEQTRSRDPGELRRLLLGGNCVPGGGSNVVVRADTFRAVGGFDESAPVLRGLGSLAAPRSTSARRRRAPSSSWPASSTASNMVVRDRARRRRRLRADDREAPPGDRRATARRRRVAGARAACVRGRRLARRAAVLLARGRRASQPRQPRRRGGRALRQPRARARVPRARRARAARPTSTKRPPRFRQPRPAGWLRIDSPASPARLRACPRPGSCGSACRCSGTRAGGRGRLRVRRR